jgi:hypothetical protein
MVDEQTVKDVIDKVAQVLLIATMEITKPVPMDLLWMKTLMGADPSMTAASL